MMLLILARFLSFHLPLLILSSLIVRQINALLSQKRIDHRLDIVLVLRMRHHQNRFQKGKTFVFKMLVIIHYHHLSFSNPHLKAQLPPAA